MVVVGGGGTTLKSDLAQHVLWLLNIYMNALEPKVQHFPRVEI